MKPKPLITGLALASLFFAALLPPEAYPDGKLAVILCATFVFFASVLEGKVTAKYVWSGLVIFALLVLHSLVISVDAYRSIEFISVLWAYYCLLGFFLYAGFEPVRPVSMAMVVLSIAVSGYGIYQYFWGFEQLYDFVFYSSSDQVFKTPALDRIEERRVFSTLALPGTLWGFLVIALPFHAALWSRNRYGNALLVLSAAMVLATGFLTRSFGFLVGLFVLTVAWIALRHRRVLWNKVALAGVILILVAGIFYAARRGAIDSSNPVSLRFKNWVSAWTIFADNPSGTGLNTYGVMYPRHMLPGANETQYAHNTPLQLLAEGGYFFVLAAGALLLFGVRAWARGARSSLSQCMLAALAVWVVHNLIDINVYFPSVGVIGAVLLGVLLRREPAAGQRPRKALAACTAAAGLAILTFSALNMVSSELQNRSRAEHQENRLAAAAETLEQAKALMPLNSSLYHESGEILLNLHHNRKEPQYLTRATESFRRAIALSPAKAGPHAGLSLCFSTAARMDEALEEIHIAQSLHPDSTYLEAVVRLLEKRKATLEN
jgi:hypothetical protein